MRNSRRRKYYHNRRLKLKVAFIRTLDYLDRNTTGEPSETDKYLKRRIKEIRSCRILPGRKHQYCRSICFCDTCIRQKTHDYIDQINKFRENINDQIYFFVRSEYFIDEGIDQEVIDQHIKYWFIRQPRTGKIIKTRTGSVYNVKKTANHIHEEEPCPHLNYTTSREFVNTVSRTFPEKKITKS